MAADFLDTNVLVYFAGEGAKADRAETLLHDGGVISVQVLNELANVARRKLAMTWPEIRDLTDTIRALVSVEPVTVETHELGLRLAERHGFALYDAMIVAAALIAGASRLFSEDMQHGMIVDGRLHICNPFLA